MDGEQNVKNTKIGEAGAGNMGEVKVEKEVNDYDVLVKIEVEILDDKENLELKLAKAEKRVSELENEKVGREEEMGEVVRVGREWRRVAEEWRGEAERSEAAAKYWRRRVEEWREIAEDQEKRKGKEDKASQTEEIYNDSNETLPVHVESEATADEQMETIMVPEDEVLESQKSLRLPRRYSRRKMGLNKHHGDDGDKAEDCDVDDKSAKDKNPELEHENEMTKPASMSSKPSKGSKRKVMVTLKTDQTETLYTCTEDGCISQFRFKWFMYRHVRTVHRKKRPFVCPEAGCKKRFGQKGNMESHVRIVHRKEQPFVCPEAGCKERFRQKSNMNHHVRFVHRNERPLVCPKAGCKGRFGKRREVEDHLRVAHGHPKLVCGVNGCTSEFLSATSLSRHKRKTHKGSR